MKKNIKTNLLVVTVIAFSAACSKDMDMPAPQNQEELVTMTVSIQNELTKVSLTQDEDADGAVKLAWQGTDNIRVIDHDDAADNKLFEIQEGYTDHHASFDGSPVVASSYDIIYPGKYESVEAAQAVQFAVQNQTGNASTAQLEYMAFLSNVDSYLGGIEFSEEWATAHGGTFKQTGILRFRVQLPEGFTGNVASVTVNAPSPIFYKSNALVDSEKVSSLKLNFSGEGAVPASGVVTGYLMLPWEDVTMAANTQLSIIVETAAHSFYTKTFTPSASEAKTFKTGRVNALKINKNSFGAASDVFAGGSGTAADPWLIANATHMGNIASNLSAGSTKYFKMIDDVDMTGEPWNMLNLTSPYDQAVYFDGNYKTISNLAGTMFSVFKGTVKNLILDGCSVSSGSRKGVFAQYIQGTNNVLSNVDICNVSEFAASNNECGGMVGRINNGSEGSITATFEYCDVNNVVVNSAGSAAGGLIGSVEAKVSLSNCTCTGSVITNTGTSETSAAGGLIGKATSEIILTNCSVSKTGDKGSVVSKYNTGGLVGSMVLGSISRCSAEVDVTGTYYVGGMIGNLNTTSSDVNVSECYYKSGTVSGSRYCGGLIGQKHGASYGVSISNCYVTGSVTAANRIAGGLLGSYQAGNSASISNSFVSGAVSVTNGFTAGGIVGWVEVTGLDMSKCLAWNSSVSATITEETPAVHYSSGAVIGYAKGVKVKLASNYRKKGFIFSDCSGNTENVLTLNSGDKNDEVLSAKQTYVRPYHGKKETGETTISGFANNSMIKWSSAIWDTTTDTPTLKNNPE